LPFAPAASRTAAMDAAWPMQKVCTSGLTNCIVDREPGRDGAARAVDVKQHLPIRVLGLEKQHLCTFLCDSCIHDSTPVYPGALSILLERRIDFLTGRPVKVTKRQVTKPSCSLKILEHRAQGISAFPPEVTRNVSWILLFDIIRPPRSSARCSIM
jgi:hypothetical protein